LGDDGKWTRVGLVPDAAGAIRLPAVRETSGAQSAVFVVLGEYFHREIQLSKHRGGSPVFGHERMLCDDVNGH
jgi:hypothetical protein